MQKKFDFVKGEERRLIHFSRGSASVRQIKTSVKTFLTVLLVIVGGGQISPTSGHIVRKSDVLSRTTQQHSLLHLQAKCGLYSVCNLATHFCDTVMNVCVSCSDDCHPGRITGDSYAVDDCQKKCRGTCSLQFSNRFCKRRCSNFAKLWQCCTSHQLKVLLRPYWSPLLTFTWAWWKHTIFVFKGSINILKFCHYQPNKITVGLCSWPFASLRYEY